MKVNIGIIQISPTADKNLNLKKITEMTKRLSSLGADIVVYPETWNCPYNHKYFKLFSENKYEESYNTMKNLAKEEGIYIVGGSIPIKSEDKIYNESFVFNRKGEEIYNYKKLHMFDVVFKNGREFRESDSVKMGDSLGIFNTEFGKMGLVICYDLRFPEMFKYMKNLGAEVFFVPGNFTIETGSAHWEMLLRSRAVDYQAFVVGASVARDEDLSKNSYAHSIVVDSMGEVLLNLGTYECTRLIELNLDEIEETKRKLPIEKSRREVEKIIKLD